MTSGLGRLGSFVLMLVLAGTAGAAGDPVAAFLAKLLPPPAAPIPFVEQRMSELLATPLELRGELSLGPDGSIDKHVTAPVEERVTITAGALTLVKDGRVRTVDLAGDPRWRVFHAGIAGLLNRDAAALERVFTTTLTQGAEQWTLELRPRQSGGRNMVTLIRAAGVGGQLRTLRLEQGPGEWQEMSFPGTRP